MTDLPLNARQALFVEEYLVDLNATQAAIRAGYSSNGASAQAARLMKDPSVKTAIREAFQRRSERTQIRQDRVIKELARVAFFDPRKLYDDEGRPRSLHDLDDDTAAAVAGLDVYEEFSGRGLDRVKVGEVKKWRLANKLDALSQMAKHLGMTMPAEGPVDEGSHVVLYLPENGRAD